MTKTAPKLEIRKVNRSWCICAGASILGKFQTEDLAKTSLEADEDFYIYWAGSVGVSVENTPAKIVHLG